MPTDQNYCPKIELLDSEVSDSMSDETNNDKDKKKVHENVFSVKHVKQNANLLFSTIFSGILVKGLIN